ncbi:hypothetical protein HanRHA438_Chr15g0687661 [Helianthus annuus]|nr:hypothetical protein HanRHA438_Chr15g0687661 [Helianthus annuus]
MIIGRCLDVCFESVYVILNNQNMIIVQPNATITSFIARAANEPNVQRTVCEPFGGKVVCLFNERTQKLFFFFSKMNEHE